MSSFFIRDEGLAAFSMTNSGPIMIPTFGREMMLGSNPIAFCMPADPVPFWFDGSTTVVTLGKVEVYDKREKPMPLGWTLDKDGNAATDASKMNASILAGDLGGIGGHIIEFYLVSDIHGKVITGIFCVLITGAVGGIVHVNHGGHAVIAGIRAISKVHDGAGGGAVIVLGIKSEERQGPHNKEQQAEKKAKTPGRHK